MIIQIICIVKFSAMQKFENLLPQHLKTFVKISNIKNFRNFSKFKNIAHFKNIKAFGQHKITCICGRI
jgi:hypothetical protein